MDDMEGSNEESESALKSKKAVPFPFNLEPGKLGDVLQNVPIPGKQSIASWI